MRSVASTQRWRSVDPIARCVRRPRSDNVVGQRADCTLSITTLYFVSL